MFYLILIPAIVSFILCAGVAALIYRRRIRIEKERRQKNAQWIYDRIKDDYGQDAAFDYHLRMKAHRVHLKL